MNETLAANVVEFCSRLRRVHEFNIGPREMQDALSAIELVGITDRARVAAALRAVCCSRPNEIELFDRAFALFFSTAPVGAPQPEHAQRRRARHDRADQREDLERGLRCQPRFCERSPNGQTAR